MEIILKNVVNRCIELFNSQNLGVRRIIKFVGIIVTLIQVYGIFLAIETSIDDVYVYHDSGSEYLPPQEEFVGKELQFKEAFYKLCVVLFVPLIFFWGTLFVAMWIREGFKLQREQEKKKLHA